MRDSSVMNAAAPVDTGAAGLDALFDVFNRSDAPGLAVGVARHGEVVYRRGFGLASVELAVANTPFTRMRIGSTSKHFTCLAALLLAEEGKLDLDAGVRRHLPELPALDAEPTLRQLMNHTGGYRCHLDIGFLADGMAIKPAGQALAAQLRQREANFAPGQKLIYNNSGYHLLSIAISRASGMAFEAFLAERIFKPLGMIDTVSAPSDFEIHRGMATMHVALPAGGYRRGIFPSTEVRGEGAMISTVDDMLRWLAHLRGAKRVGSDASWTQMLALARLDDGVELPYALGLMRHVYRGVEVVHHAGGVIGGACQMLTVPAHGLDVIIMSNGAPIKPWDLSRRVVDIMLADTLTSACDTQVASADRKALLGRRYVSRSSGFMAAFADVDGALGLEVLHQAPMALHAGDGKLRTRFEESATGPFAIDLAALPAGAGAPATLRVSEGSHAEDLELLPETPPTLAQAGRDLVGRYRAPELDAHAVLRLDGDVLRLALAGRFGSTSIQLEALGDDVFGWQMEGDLPLRGALRVERRNGRVAGLRMDTMRTRHLLLEREE
ncbi:serine hydrolase [Massilia sp. HP4]|uniref:serine hydrolase domain-containing protein n=1 Tax=Massilia sp. HP4 TaxID=2562316 RepID=UPI001E63B7B5|nr:serine hydrolase domain-containing protein [Massilia sp. HP4]